jgi:type IV secretion system protein TrbG
MKRSLPFVVGLLLVALPAHADGQTRRVPRAETPIEVLAAANDASRQRPTRNGFEAARHVYSYAPGAIYELYTNPNYVSTILLEPGETLNSIAAGDTSRWMVTQADAETDGDGRTVVLVKPQAANLRTNVVLITDRRTYLIEAISQAGSAYSAQIAWSYPGSGAAPSSSTPLDAINLHYRVRTVRGGRPTWTPARVFDDGRRTWIEFDPRVAASDLPPLFVVTAEGAELVNYRVLSGPAGQRYEVDRIFDIAELRLGTRAPIIVRIERNPAPAPRRRSHRP